ncbi:MAG: hypothetical protein ACRDTH_11820 [Pseudonocardiaceae bacterium]
MQRYPLERTTENTTRSDDAVPEVPTAVVAGRHPGHIGRYLGWAHSGAAKDRERERYSPTRTTGSQVPLLAPYRSPFAHVRVVSGGSARARPIQPATSVLLPGTGMTSLLRPTMAVALEPVMFRARNVPASAIDPRRTVPLIVLIAVPLAGRMAV